MSLAVQRDGEIAAVAAVDAPLPTPATTTNPTLPSSKYFGITPTNAQTSLLRHKEGNPCAVSIFRYHVCISTRPSGIGPTKLRLFPLKLCKCSHQNIAL